ncbi:hypothetical protein MLD38_037034 [Melastoma candidum]|uniref:Uncharacterized protein n=1 Tax=Melastoma candidum TaxID=119954 RepID=A0ACB9LLH0_9MYRT|nr:hypothetical protein MLD38_037034 [Melastoma candidum]
MPNISERNETRDFILQKDASEVFRLTSIELDFLYEFFYTKIMAANSGWGVFICTIAYSGTLAAFILFCLADKDEFWKVDIAITYALFAGVFVLDVAGSVMVVMSDWTNTNNQWYLFYQFIGQGCFPFLVGIAVHAGLMFCFEGSAFISVMDRVWSEKMGSFNLLSHCFGDCAPRKCRKPGFVWEKLVVMRSTSKEAINPELWGLVFKDLERKATNATDAETMRQVYEARGDWAIEESLCHELLPYINDFEYDNTLLIWHIATEICYNIEGDVG